MQAYEILEDIWGIIQENPGLQEQINHSLEHDSERIKLLHEIFLGMNHMGIENIRSMVYEYGALVKEPDLLARQMFLCLHAILESMDGKFR